MNKNQFHCRITYPVSLHARISTAITTVYYIQFSALN